MKKLWLKLKSKPWFAGLVLAVGAVVTTLFFMWLRGGDDDGPPPPKISFTEKAKAEADAASKELEVRAMMTAERTEEEVAEVNEILKEKDPVKRGENLSNILTSWGS
jgi:hypothetical protein